MGGGGTCMPVFVPPGPIFPASLHSSPLPTHTAIVPCSSLTSGLRRQPLSLSKSVSMGKESFHHAVANRANGGFMAPFCCWLKF